VDKTFWPNQGGLVHSTTAGGGARAWPRWTPYAAVVWSLIYAALGAGWAASGRGFPYDPQRVSGGLAPVVGRLGAAAAWGVVIAAGLPAAVVGVAMLRGARRLRPVLIAAGVLVSGTLLLLMTDINLLITLAYIPLAVAGMLTRAAVGQAYLESLTQWTLVHQWLCLIGGFLWLGAVVSYARRSGEACLSCGRRDGPEGWTSPARAARWGRAAVYLAMAVPVLYAVTRYLWALGIPFGVSPEYLRLGQEQGIWTSGLSLATFGLVGAGLMLGLVQPWGEVFPRWLIGLAGRPVPLALAVAPASIVSVLLLVGGITVWSSYAQMAASAAASGQALWIVVGPVFLFPIWGASLAVATLGYYYRRRGPCRVCGRGAPG
jgi:hypothetical protein